MEDATALTGRQTRQRYMIESFIGSTVQFEKESMNATVESVTTLEMWHIIDASEQTLGRAHCGYRFAATTFLFLNI